MYIYAYHTCTVYIRCSERKTKQHITRPETTFVNPRRACAARVTVVGSVCLSVCSLSHISPLERLFVLKSTSRTQRATNVKKFVGFSLKLLRCGDPALPPSYGLPYGGHFSSACANKRGVSTCAQARVLASRSHAFSARLDAMAKCNCHGRNCAEGLHFSAFH